MRNSSNGLIVGVLLVFGLALLSLFLYQSAWLKLISYMLNSDQSAGLPVSSTPITGFSFPTAAPAARPGTEVAVGKLAITVTRVVRPADTSVARADGHPALEIDEQFLLVDIAVRCLSTDGTVCRLTEFDFGVSNSAGRDYPAEFSSSFPGLQSIFEGGDIEPGRSLAGSLIFIIHKSDTGLTMRYPRMYNFGGPSAEFLLGQ